MASVGASPLGATPSDKPRLPRLRANVNRRAQQIIAAHMCSESTATGAVSSTATVPVLMQLESTAPRTARTHDISHLCDHSSYLAPRVPPSLVEECDHIYEASFMPKDSSSVYSDVDGLWHTKVFPSDTPSSRTDAVLLDSWVTKSLKQYRDAHGDEKEDLARAVEDLVPILSVALHEIVRQVTHHCIERGLALEKIWQTYVELFDRVLHQMRDLLQTQKRRTSEAHGVLSGARKELRELRKGFPKQMQSVIADLEVEFTARQREYEEQLEESTEENTRLKQELRMHHRELELWYPGFSHYQDSYIKNHISQGRGKRRTEKVEVVCQETEAVAEDRANENPPEVAITDDFKRLLAVLAPDKRKAMGKDLSTIFETPGGAGKKTVRKQATVDPGPQSQESEEVEKLQAQVRKQEEHIQELRDEIASLEAEEASASFPAPVESVGGPDGAQGQGSTPPLSPRDSGLSLAAMAASLKQKQVINLSGIGAGDDSEDRSGTGSENESNL